MMQPHVRLSSPETELLAGLSIFACLDADELDDVASQLQRRSFAKGEIIYHRDDLPGCLYILVKGHVKIRLISETDNRQVTFAWITPGRFFGTISLLDEGHRNSDCVAVEPCQILSMSHDGVSRLPAQPSRGDGSAYRNDGAALSQDDSPFL